MHFIVLFVIPFLVIFNLELDYIPKTIHNLNKHHCGLLIETYNLSQFTPEKRSMFYIVADRLENNLIFL